MPKKERLHYLACNLCEAICGLEIKTKDANIISIKGDKQDPLSQGHICPKAIALQDIYSDPDRVRTPLKKTSSGWQSISWNQAFDEVVGQLARIQNQHGNDAVAVYQGNPSVHSIGIMVYAKLFLKQLQTRNRYSATSVDQLPHHLMAATMFGHELMLPVPDIDRTHFMVIIGANPIVSNGSMMTAPGFPKRVKALQARRGKLIVIDPRKSETANISDRHLFIQPGTDVYLLAAMLNLVVNEYEPKLNHLKNFVNGLNGLKQLFKPWTTEIAERVTGIKADDIHQLVHQFYHAESAILYGRMGVSTQQFGSLCQWMITLFNIFTGNFDRPGGAMFTLPAVDVLQNRHEQKSKSLIRFNRYHSRVKQLPEWQGELPVTTLVDEIITGGPGQIKAMVFVAGNPVLSAPNGKVLDSELKKLDFIVAVDCYINETTRHANIILPPSSILERPHYDYIFHNLAVRNTTRYSTALFKPNTNSKSDGEIFIELAYRWRPGKGIQKILRWLQKQYLLKFGLENILDSALKSGPYGKSHGLSLAKVKSTPHGIDLGPLQSCLPDRLFTVDKTIDLIPTIFFEAFQQLTANYGKYLSDKTFNKDFPYRLIGRREARTCNSWMHNSHRLIKGKPRCRALIHPQIMKQLGLNDNQTIKICSATGCIELQCEASNDILPGVISVPHGWGHNLDGVKMRTAVSQPGVSINDITDQNFYDEVCGNAAFNGVPVRIEMAQTA